MFLHVYVNLFNFLLDLVEAIRTQLALNVGCKASLKKFTNRQAAGWLDLMIKFTKIHSKRPGPAQHISEINSCSLKNASWAGLWWLLLASVLPWCFLCTPFPPPQGLYLHKCLSIWCPTVCDTAYWLGRAMYFHIQLSPPLLKWVILDIFYLNSLGLHPFICKVSIMKAHIS